MTPSLMDETGISEAIEQGKKKDQEKDKPKENQKQEEANYILSETILNEFQTNDYSKEGHERPQYKKVTWKSYKRYFEEHKEDIQNKYDTVCTPDGDIISKPKEEKDINEGRDKAEIVWDDELKNYKLTDTEWLIQGMIPRGGIGVWTGNRATFKSFLVLNAAYCISNGLNFLGKYPTEKGKVIYLDKENGIPIMQRRSKMIKKGLNIEKGDVGFICFSQLRIDELESIQEIEDIIEKHKPSLLVIDTYRRAISFDENDAGNVSQLFVNVLRPIVDKYRNLSIVLIHHNRKGGGHGDKMDEIRGSSDLANYCDFILSNKRKGNNVILEQLKNRNAPEMEPVFVKIETDEEETITFTQGEGEVLKTKDQIATEELLLWITKGKLKEFGTGDWSLHATTKGIKRNCTANALTNLCDSGILEKKARGEYNVVSETQSEIK